MDQIEIHWVWWLIAAVVLGVIEILTLDLVLLMFSVGALAAIVASLLGAGITGQVLTFILTSLFMLLVLRPYLLRNLRRRMPVAETNTAAQVGREALVLRDVTDLGGLVKLAGEEWSARTADTGVVVPSGARVRVVGIDGATAVVVPVDPDPDPDPDRDTHRDPEEPA